MRFLSVALEYLLGFLALAVFAYLAFAAGPASDERFVHAFSVASVVALLELVALLAREVVVHYASGMGSSNSNLNMLCSSIGKCWILSTLKALSLLCALTRSSAGTV